MQIRAFLTGPGRVSCWCPASVVTRLRLFNPPARPGCSTALVHPYKGIGPPRCDRVPAPQPTHLTPTTFSVEFIKMNLRLDSKNNKLGDWSAVCDTSHIYILRGLQALAMGGGQAGRKGNAVYAVGVVRAARGTRRHAATAPPPARPPPEQGSQACCPAGHDGGATCARATHTARRGGVDEQQPVAKVDRSAAPRPRGRGEHDELHGNRAKMKTRGLHC